MLELMQKIIFQVTGKSDITYDTDFIQDLALNSFDIMNIISAFEDQFDISIPTRDVWKLHQVKDAIAYMRNRGIDSPS
ncbi:MAG: acyl carrier protein [Oscillospiraceae bacterium]|nr:acyl carrier protein [Oscillospiraceae bacterium]